MLVISNSLAPFGELEKTRVLDYLFIWNHGKCSSAGWDYGYAIVTQPSLPVELYRNDIRKGIFERFAVHGEVLGHDRTLPIWELVRKVTSQLDMNTPKLQWHLSRKGMYP